MIYYHLDLLPSLFLIIIIWDTASGPAIHSYICLSDYHQGHPSQHSHHSGRPGLEPRPQLEGGDDPLQVLRHAQHSPARQVTATFPLQRYHYDLCYTEYGD